MILKYNFIYITIHLIYFNGLVTESSYSLLNNSI